MLHFFSFWRLKALGIRAVSMAYLTSCWMSNKGDVYALTCLHPYLHVPKYFQSNKPSDPLISTVLPKCPQMAGIS